MSSEIHDMFASIASKYDVANDILSVGIHRLWRQKLVRLSLTESVHSVLDLCTGTGDLAFAFARQLSPPATIIGLDFVKNMLVKANEKSKTGREATISFVQGDATSIPFPSKSFDLVSVAFGVRNIPALDRCFREVIRVLKPQGRFFVLEFGQVNISGFKQLYDWYGRTLMPMMGKVITGNRAAYEYLPKTSLEFPAGAAFTSLLQEYDFCDIIAHPLLGGMAYIYEAGVPQRVTSSSAAAS